MEEIMRIQDDYTDEAANAYSVGNYWLSGDDHLLTCPYDMEHKIRHYRMESHLLKCHKQHPDAVVATCPYNATHVLPIRFFSEHVAGCPDYRMVDPDQRGVLAENISRGRLFRACIKNTEKLPMTCRMFEVDPNEKPPETFKGKPKKYTCSTRDYTKVLDKDGKLKPGREMPLALIDDGPDALYITDLPPKEEMMRCMKEGDGETRAYIHRNVGEGGSEYSMYAHGGVLDIEESEEDSSKEPVASTSGLQNVLKGNAETSGSEKLKVKKIVGEADDSDAPLQNPDRKIPGSKISVPEGQLLDLDD